MHGRSLVAEAVSAPRKVCFEDTGSGPFAICSCQAKTINLMDHGEAILVKTGRISRTQGDSFGLAVGNPSRRPRYTLLKPCV